MNREPCPLEEENERLRNQAARLERRLKQADINRLVRQLLRVRRVLGCYIESM